MNDRKNTKSSLSLLSLFESSTMEALFLELVLVEAETVKEEEKNPF
jgi:hypothetical protein